MRWLDVLLRCGFLGAGLHGHEERVDRVLSDQADCHWLLGGRARLTTPRSRRPRTPARSRTEMARPPVTTRERLLPRRPILAAAVFMSVLSVRLIAMLS
jgi:hypothetical protein